MRFVEVHGNRLSAIGLGTWQFGSKDWGYGSEYADVEAGRILERAARSRRQRDRHRGDLRARQLGAHRRQSVGDRRKEAFVATKVLPIAADRRLRREARPQQCAAARHRRDRPLPGALAEPGRADRTTDGRHASPPARGRDHRGRRQQLLADRWRAAEQALGTPVLSNQVQYSLVARKPDAELVPTPRRTTGW